MIESRSGVTTARISGEEVFLAQEIKTAARIVKIINAFFIKDVVLVKPANFCKKAGAKIQQFFNYKRSRLFRILTFWYSEDKMAS